MSTTTTTTADPLDIKDCPVNKSMGTDDPNNVFTCKKSEECCTVNLEPACCAEQDMSVAINQQLGLWLPLLGVIVLLSVFIWWCRTDEACCDVEKPCLYRFGCKKYPKDDEDNETDSKGSQLSLRSTKSSVTVVPDEGIANDDENVATEEAANNLEEKLEPEETVEEEGANEEKAEEENSNDNTET